MWGDGHHYIAMAQQTSFYVATREDALAHHGKPDILNRSMSVYWRGARPSPWKKAISMDAKDAWRNTVFVERLWRSIKSEEVYLGAYENIGETCSSIGRYLDFYNAKRPHQSLDDNGSL